MSLCAKQNTFIFNINTIRTTNIRVIKTLLASGCQKTASLKIKCLSLFYQINWFKLIFFPCYGNATHSVHILLQQIVQNKKRLYFYK
jgi:hypothetical protein